MKAGPSKPMKKKANTNTETVKTEELRIVKGKTDQYDNDKNNEMYIMDKVGVLPRGRYGVIPGDLHSFIYPNVALSQCSKSLNSSECVVRRGIGNESYDSLMDSIAYLLGLENKKKLLQKIKKVLDPLTFITLENGHVLTAFMDYEPIIPVATSSIYREWKQWIAEFPKYSDLFGISTDIKSNALHVSRELAIFKSYRNFIMHLSSTDRKNPSYLVDLMQRIGILLVVWKRDDTNPMSASAMCPMFTTIDQLLTATQNVNNVIMILDDGTGNYEPLEMKIRNKKGITLFPVSDNIGSNVINILKSSCFTSTASTNATSIATTTLPFIEIIRAIHEWSQLRLFSYSNFKITTALLRPDGRIWGLMTKGNIIILTQSDGVSLYSLPLLLSTIKTIKNVIYFEDISGKQMHVGPVYTNDLQLFMAQLRKSGLGAIVGIENTSNGNRNGNGGVFYSEYIVPNNSGAILPLIRFRSPHDMLHKHEQNEKTSSKKWFQLQHAVGQLILIHYDTLIKPLLHMTKRDRINMLIRSEFLTIPDKDTIRVILEEMPLEEGKLSVANWIRSIGLEERSRIYTSVDIQSSYKNKEWIFSQAAVENGLPNIVIEPAIGYKSHDVIRESTVRNAVFTNDNTYIDDTALPKMILAIRDSSNTTIKSLPGKWGKGWSTFKIIVTDHNDSSVYKYNIKSIPDVMNWIAARNGNTIGWRDIEDTRAHLISGMMMDANETQRIIEEPSVFHAWCEYFGKKFKTPKLLWESELSKYDSFVRVQKWKDLLALKSTQIWPMDIDLEICAKLLNITIIVLFRTRYGANGNKDAVKVPDANDAVKRGDLSDLSISSTVFVPCTQYMARPCIMLYRESEKTFIKYSAIVMEPETFVIKRVDTLPKVVIDLIQFHLSIHN